MQFLMRIKLILFLSIKPKTDSTCMLKSFFVLSLLLTVSLVHAQTDSLTNEEKRMLDSMFKNDEFIKLMLKKEKSYVDVNVGMGNGVFSLQNNALNAGQAQTNKIYYTASVGYNHKSGLGITLNSFFADDKGSLKGYQYAVSPSYIFSNKKFDAGISYTRFIEGSAVNFDISPYKNDFYASAVYKKTWIEPGLALGFSFGKQVEYFDTVFWRRSIDSPYSYRAIHIGDTITTRLSGLSLTLSATHKWDFYALLNKKDAIELQPSFLLNAGSQRWNISHSSSLNNRLPLVQNYLKRKFGNGSDSQSFNLQSFAFLAEVTYYYGKFYFQPQLYLDYYLPSTTEKRLTSLFSVVAGFSFY